MRGHVWKQQMEWHMHARLQPPHYLTKETAYLAVPTHFSLLHMDPALSRPKQWLVLVRPMQSDGSVANTVQAVPRLCGVDGAQNGTKGHA